MSPLLRLALIVAAGLSLTAPVAHAATGWSATATLAGPAAPTGSPPVLNGSEWPAIGTDKVGNVTAAWTGDGTAGWGIYSSTRGPAATSPWSTPVRVGAAVSPRHLRLAVGAAGHAVVSWVTGGKTSASTQLMAASRLPSGVWSTPAAVATADQAGKERFGRPAFGIDSAGRSTGVWNRQVDDDMFRTVGAASQAAGGAFADTALPFSMSAGEIFTDPELAVDEAGNATLIYIDAAGVSVHAITRPAGGSWQAPVLLDTATGVAAGVIHPRIAVSAAGQAVAVWVTGAEGAGMSGFASVRSVNGQWSTKKPIFAPDPLEYVQELTLGIDETGSATAAYAVVIENVADGTFRSEVRSTSAAFGATWSAPEPRSPRLETQEFRGLSLAVGAGGHAAAVWSAGENGTYRVFAAVRRAGSTWDAWEVLEGAAKVFYEDPCDVEPCLRFFERSPLAAVAVDATGRVTTLVADERKILTRAVDLAPPAAGPGPSDPGPGGSTPTDAGSGSPAPPAAVGGTTKPPATTAAKAPKLVIAMYIKPTGKKCPASARGTVAKVPTTLKVKKAKQRGKLVCKVTGTIQLTSATKVGAKVSVLVTAKGVKRKTVQFVAVA